MNARLVLYAGGATETSGPLSLPPPPGDPLDETGLGSAHILIRRSLSTEAGFPSPQIRFESPLRVRGRIARGSDLRDPTRLRRLLTWARPELKPDLAIVLVDRDGEASRKRRIESSLQDIMVPFVVGVAREEFESWLLADGRTVSRVFGITIPTVSPAEKMAPGDAKQTLADWFGRCDAKDSVWSWSGKSQRNAT